MFQSEVTGIGIIRNLLPPATKYGLTIMPGLNFTFAAILNFHAKTSPVSFTIMEFPWLLPE